MSIEEIAKSIKDVLDSYQSAIPSFDDFKKIARREERQLGGMTGGNNYPTNDEELQQMHQSLIELKDEFGGRGQTDTMEQLRGRNREELDNVRDKTELAHKATTFLIKTEQPDSQSGLLNLTQGE